MNTNIIIVTRHAGMVEWLSQNGITGEVIAHVTDPEQIKNKIVVGVLPMNLAAEALAVTTVDMPGLREDQRGKELTPEEMDAAGAILKSYLVCEASEREIIKIMAELTVDALMGSLRAVFGGPGREEDDDEDKVK